MPPLLRLEDLSVTYATRDGDVPAVRGVSLALERGQAYGLVGESGSGKTSVAMGIMRYLGRNGRIAGGHVRFDGQDLVSELLQRTFEQAARHGLIVGDQDLHTKSACAKLSSCCDSVRSSCSSRSM